MSLRKKFACPMCGDVTEVVDSRVLHAGVRRRRVCAAGHRFSTQEVVLRETRMAARQVTDKEIAAMQDMRDRGATLRRIAQAFNRDTTLVCKRTKPRTSALALVPLDTTAGVE